MECQKTLFRGEQLSKSVVRLQKNSLTLEYEKEKFIQNICNFVEPLNFEAMQVMADQEQILETLSKLYLLCPTME